MQITKQSWKIVFQERHTDLVATEGAFKPHTNDRLRKGAMKMHFTNMVGILLCVLASIHFAQPATLQEMGSLKLVAIDGDGNPVPNAILDLYDRKMDKSKICVNTDSAGLALMSGIPEGIYELEIKAARYPTRVVGPIRIVAGKMEDLGYRTIGPEKNECLNPGSDCFIDWTAKPLEEWKCAKGRKLLRRSDNEPVVIEHDELLRRAIKASVPTWPSGVWPGHTYSVEVVIGSTGKVVCIGDLSHLDALISRALSNAVRKWQFQPILEDGRPIDVEGVIDFTVPYSHQPTR
jgi:hypothetical protein